MGVNVLNFHVEVKDNVGRKPLTINELRDTYISKSFWSRLLDAWKVIISKGFVIEVPKKVKYKLPNSKDISRSVIQAKKNSDRLKQVDVPLNLALGKNEDGEVNLYDPIEFRKFIHRENN
jgi:hypothetical protein